MGAGWDWHLRIPPKHANNASQDYHQVSKYLPQLGAFSYCGGSLGMFKVPNFPIHIIVLM